MNDKRDKFVRLAERRTKRALKDIRLIGNLSNRNAYSFGPGDVDAILRALEAEIKTTGRRFRQTSDSEIEFSLV